jgi:class 3 adenylate cyclase
LDFKSKFPTLKRDFNKYCTEYIGQEPSDYNLKCGIHNGPAFLHYFSGTRNSIILLGSTINLASRLEGIAKCDEIIISKKLRNMVQKKFKFSRIDPSDRLKEESSKTPKIKSFEEEDIVYSLTRKKLSNSE